MEFYTDENLFFKKFCRHYSQQNKLEKRNFRKPIYCEYKLVFVQKWDTPHFTNMSPIQKV
jgi:hypothetical protein